MSADARLRPTTPPTLPLPEVYSPAEIGRAAGVPARVVEELIARAEIATVDGLHVALPDAADTIVEIRAGRLQPRPCGGEPGIFGGSLLARSTADGQSRGMSALASTGLHVAAGITLAVLTGLQMTTTADEARDIELPQLARLIFVAEPGPGGGGGGGGLRMPAPPPAAERAGTRPVSSPVPERVEPRRIEPRPTPPPPEPLRNESLPPIFAALMASPSDSQDVRGLLIETPLEDADPESQGSGTDGGVGTGGGTGIGSGQGSGVGPGSGGGTGGGPYRGGSGIAPPRLLYEARPRYTEEARRQGIEGDVVLEVVVRSDGSVGDIQILRGLGYGLDDQAVQAVRRWQFEPADRFGEPVDVVVEIAVEFNLR